MIARTLDALMACGIERIGVVGNDGVREECRRVVPVTMIADAGSGAGNVLGALDAWPDDAPLLYLTCDMPYVDAPALRWFLERVDAHALAMPLTDHAAFVRRFSNAPPSGITLAGERVVNGDVFYVPAGSRARIRTLATALFDARKAPWKMAAIAGPWLLARFVTGRLSIDAIERRASRLLAMPVAALRNAPPELAFDVDTVAGYAYALEHE